MKLSDLYEGLVKEAEENEKIAAEEDAYGRIMAHAFMDEIEKISAEMNEEPMAEEKEEAKEGKKEEPKEEKKEEEEAPSNKKEEVIKALKKAMIEKAKMEQEA